MLLIEMTTILIIIIANTLKTMYANIDAQKDLQKGLIIN